jgi:formylglycine-generating enzyme required for sulfatase activity
MALVAAGSFEMGNALSASNDGDTDELPVHTVSVREFYMDKYEVSKALWDEVASWAGSHGYDINTGSASGKATNHPVYNVTWHEAVKWSNARSQKEGLTPCYTLDGTVVMRTGTSDPECNFLANGYRLPTEAEWEKAARGGLRGKRFPWGDTITHSEANYESSSYSYDVSPTSGYHPTYATGSFPYSSPVGSFPPNAYGLYDVAGNMDEWCWDSYSLSYYATSPELNPTGPALGDDRGRVRRGGSWTSSARYARAADRDVLNPGIGYDYLGFRCVRSSDP